MGNALLSCFGMTNHRRDEDEESEEMMVPWSDLPELVLHEILMHLRGIAACTAFGQVCRTWRTAMIEFMSSVLPLMFVQGPFIQNNIINLCNLQEKQIKRLITENRHTFYIGQSRGYLIMRRRKSFFSTRRNPYWLVVMNPWTGAQWEWDWDWKITKADFTICGAFLSAAPTSPDCMLVLVFQKTIRWCRIGSSEWSSMTSPDAFSPDGIVCCGNVLYQSDLRGRILEIDLQVGHSSTDNAPIPDAQEFHLPPYYRPVLFELDGELFTILDTLFPDHTETPIIRRLDSATKRWVKVESLGFYALFVSSRNIHNQTAQVCDTRRVDKVLKNCVYFASLFRDTFTIIPLDGAVKDPRMISLTAILPFWTVETLQGNQIQ